MALQIISVFVFTLFFPKALTLKCYNCDVSSSNCSQKTCNSSSHCFSSIKYIGGIDNGIFTWDCANALYDNWTVNFGKSGYTMKVCSSDLCNNATTDSANEKSCYTCNGTDCSQTMSCKGDETKCITATGAIYPTLKGCANQIVCANTTVVEHFLSQYGFANTSLSCCDGNLCNNGQILRQGAVLLLIPVLSLLFSEIYF